MCVEASGFYYYSVLGLGMCCLYLVLEVSLSARGCSPLVGLYVVAEKVEKRLCSLRP